MRLLLIAVSAAKLLATCGDGSSPSPGARGWLREQLAECKFEGLGRNARCAELEVPEKG